VVTLMAGVSGIVLLAFAIALLFFTDKMQARAIRRADVDELAPFLSRIKVLNWYARQSKKFVQSSRYRINLRFCGTLALLMSLVFLWACIERLRGKS
jgi:hypothetical protein